MTGTRPGSQVLVAGSANVDLVVRAPHIPASGETVLGGELSVIPGGKGANQAVACARAGGAATSMLAALGTDAFAAILEESLRAANVRLFAVRSDRPTGAALITVSDEAENAITVAPGANHALGPSDLKDLDEVSWLVLQLETPIATVVAFAEAARRAGASVLLNAAPAQPLPTQLIAMTNVLVVNEAELAAVAGARGSIADRLRRCGVPWAVVTLGARGCCAFGDSTFIVQPAFRVEATDTTAAGDTFAGVLAAALAQDRPMVEALRLAAAAGALATTLAGAQSSIPDAASVAALVERGMTGATDELARYCGVSSAEGLR